jgi:hypothetical protein
MFGFGLVILALFSLVGIFADSEDPRRGADPKDSDTYRSWASYR